MKRVEIIGVFLYLEDAVLHWPYAIVGVTIHGDRYIINRYQSRKSAQEGMKVYERVKPVLVPVHEDQRLGRLPFLDLLP